MDPIQLTNSQTAGEILGSNAASFTPVELAEINSAKLTGITELKNITTMINSGLDAAGYKGAANYPMFIAGGYFASLINGEPINDIDIFVLDAGNYKFADMSFATILSTWQSSKGKILSPKDDGSYNKKPNIINIYEIATDAGRTLQFMLMDLKSRKDVIDGFDFEHCKVSCDYEHFYISKHAFDLIKSKNLEYNHIGLPAAYRIEKFKTRGWSYPSEWDDDTEPDAFLHSLTI